MTSLRTILPSLLAAVLLLLLVVAVMQKPEPLEPWLIDIGNPGLQCYIFPEDHPMRLSPADYPHEEAVGRLRD